MGINFGLEADLAANDTTPSGNAGGSTTSSNAGASSGINLKDNPFSGLASTQSIADIRAAEAQAKAARLSEAESIFNPQTRQVEETGEKQISTVVGSTGQRQGFNLSTQSGALVNAARDRVDTKLQEVQARKQSFIDSGNLAAAQRADQQEQQLFSQSLQIANAQTQYALGVAAADRGERSLDIQESQFEQSLAQRVSESLGLTPDGQQTLAAKMQQANISGTFFDAEGNEVPTFAAETARLSRELQQQGINIQEQQLAETIRAHRASEGIAAANASSTSAKNFLTRSQLNQLNTVGINDDVANVVAQDLSTMTREETVESLANQMRDRDQVSSSIEPYMKIAEQQVSNYINEVNKLTLDEQMANIFGGVGAANTSDSSFDSIGN